MGVITFNGVSSDTLGLQVTGRGAFNSPSKSYEMIQIPQKNGDIILDHGRFENIDVVYPAIFLEKNTVDGVTFTYAQNKVRVRNWLNSVKGYARLTDDYNPGEYRLACFKEAIQISDLYFQAGAMQLVFNCRPERFLRSGDTPITYENDGEGNTSVTLRNDYLFSTKPLIKVNMAAGQSGWVNIHNTGRTVERRVTISALPNDPPHLYIDCDLQQCYYEDINADQYVNANQYVQVDEFPELSPGNNAVSFSEGVSSLEITPRWWVI